MAVTDSGGTKMHLYGYDDNGNLTYDGANAYSYDPENRLTTVERVPGPLSSACDIDLKFTSGGNAVWFNQSADYYYGNDAAQSGDINDGQSTWLETTVTGPGTLRFAYKLSAQSGDEFALFIDGVYQFGRSGSIGWNEPGAFSITGSGTHTIRWKYSKDSSGSEGSDCLWIDHVRWSGAMPSSDGWKKVEYVYDPSGRRIEKKVDSATKLKFLYDGDHIIAEYDAGGTLLRKYVHGPCIDEPICLIESSGTYAGTQYYHYDALGSVVAMTNSSGNVTQLYEYSVYGQVAASDANHPNRFMFTGREFDKDTGLYYYRARYYNPEIGRFLQTDPIGYGDGVNMYAYCHNNSVNCADPFGRMTEQLYRRIVLGIHVYVGDDPTGHCWISITRWGVTTTYGLWDESSIGDLYRVRSDSDLRKNVEMNPGMKPDVSRYTLITEEQAASFDRWVNQPHQFNWFGLIPTNNCASWASDTWDRITGEEIVPDSWLFGVETPGKLRDSIASKEYEDPSPSDLLPGYYRDLGNSDENGKSSGSSSSVEC